MARDESPDERPSLNTLSSPAQPVFPAIPRRSIHGFQRSGSPQENNPKSGSVSWFFARAATGKHRYSLLFISCGEYGQSSPRLPKYGRFPPCQTAINGLSTALVFAAYSRPSDPKKGCRNANMRLIFSDGDPSKNDRMPAGECRG